MGNRYIFSSESVGEGHPDMLSALQHLAFLQMRRGDRAAAEATLRDLLRRRIEAVYGEFRTLDGSFRLVSAGGQPGVAPDADGGSDEVWVGRALVLNAPRDALARCVAQDPIPDLLEAEPTSWRRLQLHWRLPRALVPEAMAGRGLSAALPR